LKSASNVAVDATCKKQFLIKVAYAMFVLRYFDIAQNKNHLQAFLQIGRLEETKRAG